MLCRNCGTPNEENSRFCIKCGAFFTINTDPQPEVALNPTQINNFNRETNGNVNTKNSFGNYFLIIIAILLKPFTALKSEMNNMNKIKHTMTLALIVTITATIVTLVKTIISAVRIVTPKSFFGETKTEWVWENLKEIEYVKLIFMSILIFLGIIFAIACIYYIAGLILKKQPNFSKLLGIASVSVVPLFTGALLVAPLLAMFYAPLGLGSTIIGGIYTLILIYETMNNEIRIEGNLKYYFNLICLSILLIIIYAIYTKFFFNSISSNISDLLNIFN